MMIGGVALQVRAQVPPFSPPCSGNEITVKPGAWASANISVRRGQIVSVRATGLMRYKEGQRIEFEAGGDRYGVWGLHAKVGSQIEKVGKRGTITVTQDGSLELGAPPRANLPVGDGNVHLDPKYHFCAEASVTGDTTVSTVRIQTTGSCVNDDNETAKPLGGVRVTIGGQTVTTDASGRATIQLPMGVHPVGASWQDSVLGFAYQAGTLFKPLAEAAPSVDVRKAFEAIEVRMLTCDKTGQAKARARIASIGSSSSMKVRIRRADTGRWLVQDAAVGLVLRDGDVLDVEGTGKLDWLEGGTISIERSSTIVIGADRPADVPPSCRRVGITRGLLNLWFDPARENKERRFGIGTGSFCFTPKGTRFTIDHDEQQDRTILIVQEGEVEITSLYPSTPAVTLRAGQQVEISGSQMGQVRQSGGANTTGTTAAKLSGKFGLKTACGKFLNAVRGGGIRGPGAMNSDASQISGWETFTFIPLPDGTYAIQTASGNYLTAMGGGGLTGAHVMHTDAIRIEAWEKFTLVDLGNGEYAIRTFKGNYLTAVNGGCVGGGRGAIHSNATMVGGWERFKLIGIGQQDPTGGGTGGGGTGGGTGGGGTGGGTGGGGTGGGTGGGGTGGGGTGGGENVITVDWARGAPYQGQNIRVTYNCPAGGNAGLGSVWGTDHYTYDSSVCIAAVHSGLITFASGGRVTFEMRQGAPGFKGSTRNGVSSRDWGAYHGSFVFVR